MQAATAAVKELHAPPPPDSPQIPQLPQEALSYTSVSESLQISHTWAQFKTVSTRTPSRVVLLPLPTANANSLLPPTPPSGHSSSQISAAPHCLRRHRRMEYAPLSVIQSCYRSLDKLLCNLLVF